MYDAILINAGYSKHGTETRQQSQCWIHIAREDINVDNATGLWASETADDAAGFGFDEASLIDYLAHS
jgi:hypothetical protein